MGLLTALCGGIALYLYSAEVSKSERVLQTAMEHFEDADPANFYTDAGRGLVTVRLDQNGMRLMHRAWHLSLTDETLDALLEQVVGVGETGTGRMVYEGNTYRYLYERKYGEAWVALTDCTQEIHVQNTVRYNIVWFLLLGGLLLLPVSLLLSYWVTRPIATAWEKQNDFVSDATHELKTPLAVIAADTEAVLANPEATVGSQAKWLGSIRGETTRMAGLVSQLLFLAKTDAHEIRLTVEPTPISEQVEGLCMEWETKAFELNRMFDYGMTQGLRYNCDWRRMRQMLEALLDNAIKYTPKGGQIHLVMNRDRKQRLRIVVSNEGEEIPAEQLGKIFDRFYRIDPSRARETGGYGLGLCVAKCIAQLHGGDIMAESAHGINTFTVLLHDVPPENLAK